MFASLRRNVSPLAFAALAVFASASSLRAQDNSVSGRVRASGSNEPLSGAQITVVGGQQRAATDDEGRFRISGLSGTNVALDVRRIGYRSERVSARVGQSDLSVALTSNPTSLEAIVVTGQPGAAARREIGNSIGVINASDVVATAPILNTQG